MTDLNDEEIRAGITPVLEAAWRVIVGGTVETVEFDTAGIMSDNPVATGLAIMSADDYHEALAKIAQQAARIAVLEASTEEAWNRRRAFFSERHEALRAALERAINALDANGDKSFRQGVARQLKEELSIDTRMRAAPKPPDGA